MVAGNLHTYLQYERHYEEVYEKRNLTINHAFAIQHDYYELDVFEGGFDLR